MYLFYCLTSLLLWGTPQWPKKQLWWPENPLVNPTIKLLKRRMLILLLCQRSTIAMATSTILTRRSLAVVDLTNWVTGMFVVHFISSLPGRQRMPQTFSMPNSPMLQLILFAKPFEGLDWRLMHTIMCPSSQNDRNDFRWTGLKSIVIEQQRISGQLFFLMSQNSISLDRMGGNGAGGSQEKLWTRNTRRRKSNMVAGIL